jgi:hypothetical protein
MPLSTFTLADRRSPQHRAAWSLSKALASLLHAWRRPRPLYPDELSEHWRRDLGLPVALDRQAGAVEWLRLSRW